MYECNDTLTKYFIITYLFANMFMLSRTFLGFCFDYPFSNYSLIADGADFPFAIVLFADYLINSHAVSTDIDFQQA